MSVRVAFDIGGVLSKYPDILREMARALMLGGASIFVITDMLDRSAVLEMLVRNGFEFVPVENVYTADYDTHGEGCKAVLLESLRIDVFLDDFIGYAAVGGAPVRCLVMPDASLPYYAEAWQTVGDEGSFGRRVYPRKVAP